MLTIIFFSFAAEMSAQSLQEICRSRIVGLVKNRVKMLHPKLGGILALLYASPSSSDIIEKENIQLSTPESESKAADNNNTVETSNSSTDAEHFLKDGSSRADECSGSGLNNSVSEADDIDKHQDKMTRSQKERQVVRVCAKSLESNFKNCKTLAHAKGIDRNPRFTFTFHDGTIESVSMDRMSRFLYLNYSSEDENPSTNQIENTDTFGSGLIRSLVAEDNQIANLDLIAMLGPPPPSNRNHQPVADGDSSGDEMDCEPPTITLSCLQQSLQNSLPRRSPSQDLETHLPTSTDFSYQTGDCNYTEEPLADNTKEQLGETSSASNQDKGSASTSSYPVNRGSSFKLNIDKKSKLKNSGRSSSSSSCSDSSDEEAPVFSGRCKKAIKTHIGDSPNSQSSSIFPDSNENILNNRSIDGQVMPSVNEHPEVKSEPVTSESCESTIVRAMPPAAVGEGITTTDGEEMADLPHVASRNSWALSSDSKEGDSNEEYDSSSSQTSYDDYSMTDSCQEDTPDYYTNVLRRSTAARSAGKTTTARPPFKSHHKKKRKLWTKGTLGFDSFIEYKCREKSFEKLHNSHRLDLLVQDGLNRLPLPSRVKSFLMLSCWLPIELSTDAEHNPSTG